MKFFIPVFIVLLCSCSANDAYLYKLNDLEITRKNSKDRAILTFISDPDTAEVICNWTDGWNGGFEALAYVFQDSVLIDFKGGEIISDSPDWIVIAEHSPHPEFHKKHLPNLIVISSHDYVEQAFLDSTNHNVSISRLWE